MFFTNLSKIIFIFNIFTFSESFTLNEHKSYKWLTKAELQELDWAAADIGIVEDIL